MGVYLALGPLISTSTAVRARERELKVSGWKWESQSLTIIHAGVSTISTEKGGGGDSKLSVFSIVRYASARSGWVGFHQN